MIRRLILLLIVTLCPILSSAQPGTSNEDLGSCTLKDYVYHCDSAAFAQSFAAAKNVTIQAQNVDSYSRDRLKDMLVRKYGKQVTERSGAPELVFLIVPVGVDGMNISPGEPTLGSLRVYSATADGARQHLLWAETFNGPQDLPWPAVARALILQFEKHFPSNGPATK
jgi:hypothetical protein